MRIAGARLTPLGGADGGCLVELATDSGLQGVAVGETAATVAIPTVVEELLRGEDPRATTGLWQRMQRASQRPGGGSIQGAIALLDIALWDLKAKANGEPLWKTLGGSRPRVNTYLSCIASGDDDRPWLATVDAQLAAYGFRGAKLAVAADAADDRQRLVHLRQALRRNTLEPELMLAAEAIGNPKLAIARIRGLECDLDLTWVEAPAPRWDYLGLKRVSNGIRAAVCAGGGVAYAGELLPHFQHHALDVVQLDTRRSGITAAMQIADTAYGFELPVTLARSPGNADAHLGAALPYCMSMEIVVPQAVVGALASDVRIENGWAVAGDRPGNGLRLDTEPGVAGTTRRGSGA